MVLLCPVRLGSRLVSAQSAPYDSCRGIHSPALCLCHSRTQHLTGHCASVFAMFIQHRAVYDCVLYSSGWHDEPSSAAGQIIAHFTPFLRTNCGEIKNGEIRSHAFLNRATLR